MRKYKIITIAILAVILELLLYLVRKRIQQHQVATQPLQFQPKQVF